MQRSAALRDALAEHHYSQFPFKPQLNERSRRIARVRRGAASLALDQASTALASTRYTAQHSTAQHTHTHSSTALP